MNIRNRVLGTSTGYWSMKRIFAANNANKIIVEEYLQPRSGERILDVGCGVGDIVNYMGDATYIGVDQNADYIAKARKKSPNHGTFINASVEDLPQLDLTGFDKVIIIGVLHHLDDQVVADLMAALPAVMKPGAQLVVAENVWTPDQATTARVLIALDRGRNVRSVDGYERFIEPHFDDVRSVFRHDLLRFPYTYVITQAVLRPMMQIDGSDTPGSHD
jgi:cyclopropane fatty-acyl-phospholipid synthase-like methyltransferase